MNRELVEKIYKKLNEATTQEDQVLFAEILLELTKVSNDKEV